MRIAFVSDLHGNPLALEAVLAESAREPMDGVVNLGDIVSGRLRPRETAERMGLQACDDDHEAAAGQAERNTRPDVAHALAPAHWGTR
jgi:predicted phosphodiesterase